MRKDTERSGDTEEDRVVLGFSETIVLEQDTRVLVELVLNQYAIDIAGLTASTFG